jgi:hypothetical protein
VIEEFDDEMKEEGMRDGASGGDNLRADSWLHV